MLSLKEDLQDFVLDIKGKGSGDAGLGLDGVNAAFSILKEHAKAILLQA